MIGKLKNDELHSRRRKKSIINAHLKLQNLFDRQNIYAYYRDEDSYELSAIYQREFISLGDIDV